MTRILTKWNNGAWFDIPNGKAYSRWGGGWFPVKLQRVKIGDVGGGYWLDSGYTGQPAMPSVPWVSSWDYTNCIFAWNAGGGGEPIDHYQYALYRDSDGANWWGTTTATNVMLGINWDNRYRFYVQAVGINGVVTGWSNTDGSTVYGRVGIGHPQQDSYGYVTRQRAWSSQVWSSFLGGNEWWGQNLDGNHFVDAFHWNNLMLDGSQIVQVAGSGGTARWVSWFMDSAWQDGGSPAGAILGGARIDRVSYFNYDVGFSPGWWGNGNVWGMGPRGAGWSSTGNTNFMLWCAAFWMSGQEMYANWELTNRVYEAGNYYW